MTVIYDLDSASRHEWDWIKDDIREAKRMRKRSNCILHMYLYEPRSDFVAFACHKAHDTN